MGILKLTFLTVGTLGVAMTHFGRDEGLPADRLGIEPSIETASIEPVSASINDPVFIIPAAAISVSAPAPVTPKPKTASTVRKQPKITPPAPDSQAGRAIAAALEMARGNDAKIIPAAAETPSAGAFETKVVTASAVNLRAGPSTRHGKLGRVTRGMAVLDMGDAAPGWTQIKVVETGQRGFMASKFLSASR